LITGDVQDPEIPFVSDEKINGVSQDEVVGRGDSESVEHVDSVGVVCVQDDPVWRRDNCDAFSEGGCD